LPPAIVYFDSLRYPRGKRLAAFAAARDGEISPLQPDKAKMAVVFAEHNRQACDMNNTRFTAADVFLGACFPVDLKILSLLQDAAAAPEKALLVPA